MLFAIIKVLKIFANAWHRRCFVFLALAPLLSVTTLSQAQNLLVNGDFEAVVQPNFGNNIGGNISPWMIGGGSRPNPVKVNGGPVTGGLQVDHTDS